MVHGTNAFRVELQSWFMCYQACNRLPEWSDMVPGRLRLGGSMVIPWVIIFLRIGIMMIMLRSTTQKSQSPRRLSHEFRVLVATSTLQNTVWDRLQSCQTSIKIDLTSYIIEMQPIVVSVDKWKNVWHSSWSHERDVISPKSSGNTLVTLHTLWVTDHWNQLQLVDLVVSPVATGYNQLQLVATGCNEVLHQDINDCVT